MGIPKPGYIGAPISNQIGKRQYRMILIGLAAYVVGLLGVFAWGLALRLVDAASSVPHDSFHSALYALVGSALAILAASMLLASQDLNAKLLLDLYWKWGARCWYASVAAMAFGIAAWAAASATTGWADGISPLGGIDLVIAVAAILAGPRRLRRRDDRYKVASR